MLESENWRFLSENLVRKSCSGVGVVGKEISIQYVEIQQGGIFYILYNILNICNSQRTAKSVCV